MVDENLDKTEVVDEAPEKVEDEEVEDQIEAETTDMSENGEDEE